MKKINKIKKKNKMTKLVKLINKENIKSNYKKILFFKKFYLSIIFICI